MRVLVSGGVKTDAITRAMEKAFSDGSVIFTSENFIKNIENFLSRGNYFDRAIIMEQSLTENGNNVDTEEMIEVIQRLVQLMNTNLLEQEILFVLNTESIAELVSTEIFLVHDRMKVLLYTSKEKYKVALFKALALTSFNELGTNINTKNLLYKVKEVETTEVYDESYMNSNPNEEEVVVQINEDLNINTPDTFDSAIFNEESLPDDLAYSSSGSDDNIGDIPGAFDTPNELGAILDDNFGVSDTTEEPIINSGVAGDIDNIGELSTPQDEVFNRDDFGEDFGNGIDTTEQTNANMYEDVFTGVNETQPVVDDPEPQNNIMYNDNIPMSNGELEGLSTGSDLNYGTGIDMSNPMPVDDKNDALNFPDELGDTFNNNTPFGMNDIGDTYDNSIEDTYNNSINNTPSSDMGTSDDMDLFNTYSEPQQDEANMLSTYFDDADGGSSSLERDEDLTTPDQSYMTDSAMLNGGMPTQQNNMGMNNNPNNMPGGMPNNMNNMPGGAPNNMAGNGLPEQKQKKGLFGGLGKKKGNAAVTTIAAGGVAAGMNNAMQNNMGNNMGNAPMVPNQQNNKPVKKGMFNRGGGNNAGGGMLSTQMPTQINIDPTRVRDDELVTMMNSYRIRGNCMVITGTIDSGSSTMAANLANIISKMGYTVLLVDMDNIGRTQAYMTREVYGTIHSTDPSNNSLRLSINNKTGEVSRYATIVREGLNLITTGLAVDFDKLESIVRDSRMLQNFIYGAKAAYNFVIFDAKFLDLTDYLKELVLNADSLVINVKPNNKGLMEFMLKMANIDDIRVREDMFRRSGIIFNMSTNNRNVLGYKVKNYQQMLEAIDKVTEELTGYTGEQSFGQMRIFNEIPFNPIFDDYIFGKGFFSDTKEGSNLYKNILRSILINK